MKFLSEERASLLLFMVTLILSLHDNNLAFVAALTPLEITPYPSFHSVKVAIQLPKDEIRPDQHLWLSLCENMPWGNANCLNTTADFDFKHEIIEEFKGLQMATAYTLTIATNSIEEPQIIKTLHLKTKECKSFQFLLIP